MRTSSIVSRLLLGLSLTTMAVQAAVILDTTVALTLADPTQLGRLSRNGIAQDWSLGEAFPGVINTGTTYHYHVFSIPNPLTISLLSRSWRTRLRITCSRPPIWVPMCRIRRGARILDSTPTGWATPGLPATPSGPIRCSSRS